MNAGVIVGLVLTIFPTLVLGAGFASGNMWLNRGYFTPEIDTGRATSRGCFWAVAVYWIVIASIGIAVTIGSWGK